MTWHLVTTEFAPRLNGIATWSVAMANALHNAGESVVVHVRSPSGDFPFLVVPMRGRSWRSWSGVWAAASVRPRRRDGDVVVCATWPLAVHLPGPILVAWHGSELSCAAQAPGREAVIARARNLPVSNFLGSLLHADHTVLPFPIVPTKRAIPGDDLLVVSRLNHRKGVDRALRLAQRLRRRIRIVGDGPERSTLVALAENIGVDAVFLGETRDIPWDGTRALLLLSRAEADGSGAEGLGLVLLEAAARGIPTVGTRVGGIPEAASVVLDDPDQDDLPTLPGADAVQAWLADHHGPARTLAVLRHNAV